MPLDSTRRRVRPGIRTRGVDGGCDIGGFVLAADRDGTDLRFQRPRG